jgi:hypothetical protein
MYFLISFSCMKEDARKLDQKTQATLRRRASVMHKNGKSRSDVANALGVNIRTVDRWRIDAKKLGRAALQVRKRGRRVGTPAPYTQAGSGNPDADCRKDA